MKKHALALGAVVGLLAALAPSCAQSPCGTSCGGCCSTSGCVDQPNNSDPTTCGTAGAMCNDCTLSGSVCDAATFSCRPPSSSGGGAGGGTGSATGGGDGGVDDCDGCRFASGLCVPRGAQQSNTVCGRNGELCQACSVATPVCQEGACVAAPKKVGDACDSDAVCKSALGPDAKCKKATAAGNFSFPGGMCVIENCSTNADCPRDSALNGVPGGASFCLRPQFFIGEDTPECVPSGCTQNNCRAGYNCVDVGNGYKSCVPREMVTLGPNGEYPNYDLPGNLHDACGQNTDCQRPAPGAPGVGGVCLTAASGYPGGQCVRQCHHDGDCTNLPSGDNQAYGICLESQTGMFCFRGCANPRGGQSNCRAGYVCDSLQGVSTGYCEPRCGSAGTTCGTYLDGGMRPCRPDGYCG